MDLQVHDADGADALREEVLEVWTTAFGPVDDADDWPRTTWDRHRVREDYRLVTARLDDRRLAGFGWGYTGRRGQYWPDLVVDRLGPAVERWVGGHFEVVELAVRPETRRRGLGGALHDALVADLPHERALLSTSSDPDDPAVRLYLGRGWTSLGLLDTGSQVMGLRLRPPRLTGPAQPTG